ncbi:MAG: type II toxin-antitoxin system VapC family toxin [Candidatus Dormibacteria bacterium]
MRFVDTSFWYALLDSRDRRHAEAASIARSRSERWVTTNNVLGETWTLVLRRGGHAVGLAFLERVGNVRDLERIHVHEQLETEAWAWLRRRTERVYSFVDATSFAVMRHRRIREALAFDGAFFAAGFVEVRAT